MFIYLALAATLSGAEPPENVVRWREDIALARSEFLARDRSYSPTRFVEARRRLDQLAGEVAVKTDQEIVAELAEVAALADNAHTRAYLLRNRGWWRRYPIRIWKFSDGWRVIAVRPGHEALLGARIMSIGGKSIGGAERAVRPLFAGTPAWASYMASYSLTSPDALLGTRVIAGNGTASFGLERDRRRWTVRLSAVTEPKRAVPEENWWFMSPAHQANAGWVHILAGRPLPPYLASPNSWYDLRHCAQDFLYMSFNRSEDQPDRATLSAFTTSVGEALERNPASRLVIDLRFNTGGNLQKTQGFFERLARSPVGQMRGRLFVILGPSTFSAGITPAAILKQTSRAIFVGAGPGDRLVFWAEGGNVLLPNSGINLHYADRAHVYGPGGSDIPDEQVYLRLNAGGLKPDRPADLSYRAYLGGRDPSAERIAPGGLQCPSV